MSKAVPFSKFSPCLEPCNASYNMQPPNILMELLLEVRSAILVFSNRQHDCIPSYLQILGFVNMYSTFKYLASNLELSSFGIGRTATDLNRLSLFGMPPLSNWPRDVVFLTLCFSKHSSSVGIVPIK